MWIVSYLFLSHLVSMGQIICIYLLREQWTAGNHRCHNSIVNRALKVALVSLRCKSQANITNEWKAFTVWRSLKTKHSFGSFRMAVGCQSPLCLSLHWKLGSSDVLPCFSLLSVINDSRVLSPLLGSVWAWLHSEMEKHRSRARWCCQSRYCFNEPPWVSVTCWWKCGGAPTAVTAVLLSTLFCSLTL